MSRITKAQRTALAAINGATVKSNKLVVVARYVDGDDRPDTDATQEAVAEVATVLAGWGWISVGWGGFEFTRAAGAPMGDFSDRNSRWHY